MIWDLTDSFETTINALKPIVRTLLQSTDNSRNEHNIDERSNNNSRSIDSQLIVEIYRNYQTIGKELKDKHNHINVKLSWIFTLLNQISTSMLRQRDKMAQINTNSHHKSQLENNSSQTHFVWKNF